MRKSSKSIGAGGGAARTCRRNRGVEQAHEEQSKIMKRRSRERRSMMRSMRTEEQKVKNREQKLLSRTSWITRGSMRRIRIMDARRRIVLKYL